MILLESKIILLTWPGLHRRTCGLAKRWRHGMLIATGCVLPLGVDWQFTSVLHLANNAPASAGVNRRARSRWCGVAWGADLSRQKAFDDVLPFKMGEAETKPVGWCWMWHGHHSLTACMKCLNSDQASEFEIGEPCEPDLNQGGNCHESRRDKEGTAKSRRRSERSELDPWNFSKVERCWKADKIWEVQKASAKCKLPGLCICRWHQHMQLARPAFCQKTQNSAGTWFDFPICRGVERLFAKWSYNILHQLCQSLHASFSDHSWPQRRRQGQCHEENTDAATKRCLDVLQICWIFPGVSPIDSWSVWSLVQCVTHV